MEEAEPGHGEAEPDREGQRRPWDSPRSHSAPFCPDSLVCVSGAPHVPSPAPVLQGPWASPLQGPLLSVSALARAGALPLEPCGFGNFAHGPRALPCAPNLPVPQRTPGSWELGVSLCWAAPWRGGVGTDPAPTQTAQGTSRKPCPEPQARERPQRRAGCPPAWRGEVAGPQRPQASDSDCAVRPKGGLLPPPRPPSPPHPQ